MKPSNVMVTRGGRVKVLDFGVAKFQQAPVLGDAAQTLTAGAVTAIGHVVGTSAYMSPEQAEGRRVDHRSDVFSLGILLYEMATGVRPFTGDTAVAVLLAIVKDAPKPITEVRPGTSADLARIIDRCLEKDPEWRVPILVAAAAAIGGSGGALLLTRTSGGAASNSGCVGFLGFLHRALGHFRSGWPLSCAKFQESFKRRTLPS